MIEKNFEDIEWTDVKAKIKSKIANEKKKEEHRKRKQDKKLHRNESTENIESYTNQINCPSSPEVENNEYETQSNSPTDPFESFENETDGAHGKDKSLLESWVTTFFPD